MSRLNHNLAVGVVALLAVPLATGARAPLNSTEQSKTAGQIFGDARTAMLHAKDFHVLAHLLESGSWLSLNLTMSPSGGGGSIQEPGVTMELVTAGKYVYVKADEESWLTLKESPTAAKTVANKWIKAPASSSNLADFVELTVSTTFVDQFLSGPGKISKLPGTAAWHGREAIVLNDGEGDRMYVAASGTPYLLRVVGSGRESGDAVSFFDFGDAPMPAVPTAVFTISGK
jgi:hypothetical protein